VKLLALQLAVWCSPPDISGTKALLSRSERLSAGTAEYTYLSNLQVFLDILEQKGIIVTPFHQVFDAHFGLIQDILSISLIHVSDLPVAQQRTFLRPSHWPWHRRSPSSYAELSASPSSSRTCSSSRHASILLSSSKFLAWTSPIHCCITASFSPLDDNSWSKLASQR